MSTFKLISVDHDAVLLDSTVHSTRHLLGDDEVIAPPKQLKLQIKVDGVKTEKLLNRETGAVRPGTKITLAGDDGKKEIVESHETFAYYSEDRDWIMTFHNHAKIDGLIVDGGKITHFTAENGKLTLNDKIQDQIPETANQSGLRKLSENSSNGRKLTIDYWENCHSAQSSGLSNIQMGMAIGNNFYDKFGSVESTDLVNSYIVNSNVIYENQMDISLQIVDIFIATTVSAAPWTSQDCNKGIQRQLSSLSNWDKPTDLPIWHLVDNCLNRFLGILGVAYLGGLCEPQLNAGVSYFSEDFNAVDYPTWATVAHEIGHNFNAQHSFEDGQGNTGGIMDYGPYGGKKIDGSDQFNTKYRQREVCAEVEDSIKRGCVDVGEGEGNTVTINQIGRSTEMLSDCSKKVHRAPIGNDHTFVARSGYNRAQCEAMCAADDCAAFVFGEALGHCELFSTLDQSETVFAPNYDTYFCGVAARGVTETEDDVLASADLQAIQDSCCSMEDNMRVEGLNRWLDSDVTKDQCFSTCVANSGCEAASWDISDNSCLYYGGADYSNELFSLNGAYTMQCSSTCVSDRALGIKNSSIGVSLGSFFGVSVAVAAVGGLYRYASSKQSKTKPVAPQSL